MNEINCPECGTVFKIDESDYASILTQVRDKEFEYALRKRLELAEKDKLKCIELAQKNITIEMQKHAMNKDSKIFGLQAKLDAAHVENENEYIFYGIILHSS